MSQKKRVAVVGCGIGRAHIKEGYAALPHLFEVRALCASSEKRLIPVADEFGIAHRSTSFEEVIHLPDVDIVDICTPPSLHFSQIKQALAAGKEVICEKPLVGSLAQLDALIEAESHSTGRVLPIFQYRYGNGVQKAKHIIDLGLAGKAYLASVETAWQRGANYYAVPWRGRFESELGGVLLTHAIHAHDMLTYLLGDIDSVFARTATRVNAIEVEDCAVASLVMKNGALASLSATLGSAKEISRLRFCFEHVTFESSLAPYAPGNDPWHIIPASADAKIRIDKALHKWRDRPTGFAGLLTDYHYALEAKTPLPITLYDARRSLELISALYDSSRSSINVLLPLPKSHSYYSGWLP